MQVSNCYRQRFGKKARKYNKPRPVEGYLVPFVTGHRKILIADVGCGPFPTTGSEMDNGTMVFIMGIDILADEYNAMMARRGIKPFYPVMKGDMEDLIMYDNIFDLVHCRNALDHTKNIQASILELNRVCREGGTVYLRHYPKVGENNNYTGQHYWNLEVIGAHCRIWNKEESFMLRDIVSAPTTFIDDGMVVSFWTK